MAVTTEPKLDAHRLRADFAVFDELVNGKPVAFLDSAASTQKPRQVLDAMRDFYEHSYANVHRGVYRLAERATTGYETARGKVAGFVNAPSEREVIFTRSATEALNLVAYAWGLDNLGPGDVVVVTDLEHHSSFVPWQYVAGRTGAAFKAIPIDESGELRLDALDEIEREGTVKVVASNLVSNTLGTVNPVQRARGVGARARRDHGRRRRAGRAAPTDRRPGARLRVPRDLVAQDVRPERDRRALGPPRAARDDGAVQPRRRDDPLRLDGADDVERAPVQVRGGHARDRRGGRASARRSTTCSTSGLAAIEQHEHELVEYTLGRLGELPWISTYGPSPERRAGIVSLNVDGVHPHDVAQVLDWEGVAVRAGHHCTQPLMAQARRHRDGARELLPVLDPRRDRPPRRRPPQGQEEPRLAVSEFDQLYRELILDHYKNPRNHGLLDPADAQAEGQNPLCGDEISVSVRLGEGDVIEEVGFDGRGCAISQAATSMLSDLVKGRTAEEVAAMPKEELLDELGIPLTPVRLKCAILGLGVLKLALHKARGTPLPEEWGTSSRDLVLE